VLVLAGTLASGGELFDVRVEAGVEVGRQDVEMIDRELNYDALVFQPYVQVSRFGTGLSFSGRIRGLFGIDEDTEIEDIDVETSVSGFDIQALAGWGFELPLGLKIIPVGGLSFRGVTTESDPDDVSGKADYEYDALFLEIGARVEASPIQRLRFIGQLTIGPVLLGEAEVDLDLAGIGDFSDTADIGIFEGYHLELRGAVDYKISEFAIVTFGAAYERFADETDEFSDIDETSEDELNRIVFNVGIAVVF
jgi:hypothetical protein